MVALIHQLSNETFPSMKAQVADITRAVFAEA